MTPSDPPYDNPPLSVMMLTHNREGLLWQVVQRQPEVGVNGPVAKLAEALVGLSGEQRQTPAAAVSGPQGTPQTSTTG